MQAQDKLEFMICSICGEHGHLRRGDERCGPEVGSKSTAVSIVYDLRKTGEVSDREFPGIVSTIYGSNMAASDDRAQAGLLLQIVDWNLARLATNDCPVSKSMHAAYRMGEDAADLVME